MKLDNKLIARMVGYRNLTESEESYPVDFDAPASTDAASDHNQINGMGDNPMKDPSKLAEEEANAASDVQLNKLHHILAGKGVSDSDIAMGDTGGVVTQDSAVQLCKLITGDDLQPQEAMASLQDMVEQLGKNLTGGEALTEFEEMLVDGRFSYTTDPFGNVSIFDADTGKSVFLQGQDAIEVLGQVENGQDDQEIQDALAQYQHVMEDMTDDEGQMSPLVNDMQTRNMSVDEIRNLQRDSGIEELVNGISSDDEFNAVMDAVDAEYGEGVTHTVIAWPGAYQLAGMLSDPSTQVFMTRMKDIADTIRKAIAIFNGEVITEDESEEEEIMDINSVLADLLLARDKMQSFIEGQDSNINNYFTLDEHLATLNKLIVDLDNDISVD